MIALLRERLATLRLRLSGGGEAALPIREWTGARAGAPQRVSGIDQPLLWVVFALVALGLVMVYSASVALPDNPKFARYAPTHFLGRHAISIAIAFAASLAVLQVP